MLKKYFCTLLGVALLITSLSACTPFQAPKEDPPIAGEIINAYKEVLSHLETIDFSSEYYKGLFSEPTYALEDITLDGVPELLIKQKAEELFHTRVFYYSPFLGKATEVKGVLIDGVSSRGGYRGSLSVSKLGDGIISSDWSSGTGEGQGIRYAIKNDQLKQAEKIKINMYVPQTESFKDIKEIIFYPLNDDSGLKKLETFTLTKREAQAKMLLGKAKQEHAEKARLQEKKNAQEKRLETLKQTQSVQIVTGTIRTNLSGEEVCAIQNSPVPYDDTELHTILILDKPTTISGHSVAPPHNIGKSKTTMLALPPFERDWVDYEGKKVTLAFFIDDTTFPSDTGIPVGQPRLSRTEVFD